MTPLRFDVTDASLKAESSSLQFNKENCDTKRS